MILFENIFSDIISENFLCQNSVPDNVKSGS